nr:zinc ABC transporter substrate-binding protein [Deltaproteobacteria bacterium]
VSIFPLYDVTRRIAGDRIEVLLVLPPGKSEHGYDPTPKEIARLDGAKLGIAVGLDMDTWVEDIMKSAGSPKVVRIGDKVPTMPIDVEPIGEDEAHGEHHDDHDDHDDDHKGSAGSAGKPDHNTHEVHEEHDEHDEHDEHAHAGIGAPDPHVWMDPDRMGTIVDTITSELSAIDPAGKDSYAKNAAAIKTSLKAVDTAIAARSKAWTKRTIVTFHGSMAYFARRYNIRIAAVVEPIAGKEPTAAYIAQVIDAIKRGQAAALFTEPQLERAPGEVIAKEAGIPLGELDPVGGVAGRDTYETLLTWNADQLEKALK